MTSISITKARATLYQLVDDASLSHEPIFISGKRNSAVLVSAGDWRSVQETLYLLSVPGLRKSIRKGLAEPLSKSSQALNW
jgi:prevent-host-death family protein